MLSLAPTARRQFVVFSSPQGFSPFPHGTIKSCHVKELLWRGQSRVTKLVKFCVRLGPQSSSFFFCLLQALSVVTPSVDQGRASYTAKSVNLAKASWFCSLPLAAKQMDCPRHNASMDSCRLRVYVAFRSTVLHGKGMWPPQPASWLFACVALGSDILGV